MLRVWMLAMASLSLLALGGCGGGDRRDEPDSEATGVPSAVSVAGAGGSGPAVESSYGTPIKDRVATLGFLNKRNNLTQDVVLKAGEARRIGNVVIRLATCERTLPWEKPAEEGAFVQVYVEERASNAVPLLWHKVFSGWMYRNSPSLNVVEHPIYDVWLKSCAMRFPGEEDDPDASPTSAAKASGRARTRSPVIAAPPNAVALPAQGPPRPEEEGAE